MDRNMNEEDQDVIDQALLEAMGYLTDREVCKFCKHFQEADRSGSPRALKQHCTLNPAMPIYGIEEGGRCKHFT